ncbi:hypothetical protein OG455_41505 [Kitasatospora sp. NBC_01287]|uniref:hypothetical protein n=1 Tax=Kitasatospora sp. NBC_01287 TaxID=2903573 RepID=UPI00225AE64A|nr:hypothetical protein [Kitasatospora sp. NBC_01287]MCX4750961.1 hypothetical protein [Kitasatospora sp. NBC_01287]MCX4751788.1 hypothetical protein [Kitasatospora sp. NBC_01287]MCX4751920.1 hypothetical protein [Kitasatospora sp. NBC_01287]
MIEAPADVLRRAIAVLRAVDDVCQQRGCGCPEELHVADADGAPWCKDCYDQHSYAPAVAEDVPKRLRGPLTELLDWATRSFDANRQAAEHVWAGTDDAGQKERDEFIAKGPSGGPEAVVVARAILDLAAVDGELLASS